jgi:hypothetical protein
MVDLLLWMTGELLCALVQCDGIHFTTHTLKQVLHSVLLLALRAVAAFAVA